MDIASHAAGTKSKETSEIQQEVTNVRNATIHSSQMLTEQVAKNQHALKDKLSAEGMDNVPTVMPIHFSITDMNVEDVNFLKFQMKKKPDVSICNAHATKDSRKIDSHVLIAQLVHSQWQTPGTKSVFQDHNFAHLEPLKILKFAWSVKVVEHLNRQTLIKQLVNTTMILPLKKHHKLDGVTTILQEVTQCQEIARVSMVAMLLRNACKNVLQETIAML